jgi:hypothetical protein
LLVYPAYHGADTKRAPVKRSTHHALARNPWSNARGEGTGPLNIAKREPEYIYHWNRIIGVLSLLVLVIGLLGYGIHAWLTPSPLTETLPPLARNSAGDHAGEVPCGIPGARSASPPGRPLAQRPASPAIPEAKDAEPVPLETTWASTPEQQDPVGGSARAGSRRWHKSRTRRPHRPPIPSTNPSSATDLEHAPADASGEAERHATDHLPSAEADPESSTPAESSAAQAPDPSPSVKAEPEPDLEVGQATAEEDTSGGPARSQHISIASPAVKRFSLAQSVLNREPRGRLDDVTYNAAGFTSISAFSEVIGLNGEVLRYRWLQEGTEVSVVRVRVGANRWRSHSTKRIDRGMEGPWRVELLDSRGTLLASIDFAF